VDAVGVCESDKTDSRPLERKPSVPFDKLILSVALGNRDEDTITSLAGRLARLDREIEDKDKDEIETVSGGKSLNEIINSLLDVLDPDKKIEKAKEMFKTNNPSEEQINSASEELVEEACAPFDNPKLRNLLIDLRRRSEQIIDTVSKDVVIYAGVDEQARERAKTIVDTFKKFIEENKDELTALQIIYGKPYGKRHLTYEQIKQLAEAIRKPPYQLTPELLWMAYEQLERAKVKGAGPQKLLTNIISLIRFAIGETDVLEPFSHTVDKRFNNWLAEQERMGRRFTSEQMEWLQNIKDHIASSLAVEKDDFELSPFYEKGGLIKAYEVFGNELDEYIE